MPSRIENLGARFFVYANTGLGTPRARSQFRSRESPVRARVYADRVRQRVHDYVRDSSPILIHLKGKKKCFLQWNFLLRVF